MTMEMDDAMTMSWTRPAEDDLEGSARKRARTAWNDAELPMMAFHMVLVGPCHLTHPLANSMIQASTNVEMGGCRWLTNETDLMRAHALGSPLQYGPYSQYPTASSVPVQRHVHVFEQLPNRLPTPCHVVFVTQSSPDTLAQFKQPLYQLPAVQASLGSMIAFSTQQQNATVSVLICVVAGITDAPIVPTSKMYCPNASIFTCWHPELESSRRSVARLLWNCCTTGKGSNRVADIPMASPLFATKLSAV